MGGKATIEREALVSDDGSFRVLPVETVVKIASQLVVSDVMKFSMASHGLQQYIRDSYNLWNFLLQRDFEKTDDEDPILQDYLLMLRRKECLNAIAAAVKLEQVGEGRHPPHLVREYFDEHVENFDYNFFDELDLLVLASRETSSEKRDAGKRTADEYQHDAIDEYLAEDEQYHAQRVRINNHNYNHNLHNNNRVKIVNPYRERNPDVPFDLKDDTLRLIKHYLFHMAENDAARYNKQCPLSIIPVPDPVKKRKMLTVSRRNKVKDVKRPFDVYKRFTILMHSQGLKLSARKKGYREVDGFIVNNKSEFEKENKNLSPGTGQFVVHGPNVITVAVTGPPQSGVSTLMHSLITHPERRLTGALRGRYGLGSCNNIASGFNYDGYQFSLMRLGVEDLQMSMNLTVRFPLQGGTVAVVLDGTKPADESLAYLAQVTEKVVRYQDLRGSSAAKVSLVVFVNKADLDLGCISLTPFGDQLKTQLKDYRSVNYAVFYTSPYLPVALDLVWDWMVAYSPKFDSSYIETQGGTNCCNLW